MPLETVCGMPAGDGESHSGEALQSSISWQSVSNLGSGSGSVNARLA
jgi:hypothetical protein